jgi:hypothetical protein
LLFLGFFFLGVAGLLPLPHIAQGDQIFSASSPSPHRRRESSGEFFLLFFLATS